MSSKYSDCFQKLSSTVTPSDGREVLAMDKILKRELSGRCLDEECIKQGPQAGNLIERLFGRKVTRLTANQLNKKYKEYIEARDKESKSDDVGPGCQRVLRPRPLQPPPKPANHDTQLAHVPDIYDNEKKEWNITTFKPSEANVPVAILQHHAIPGISDSVLSSATNQGLFTASSQTATLGEDITCSIEGAVRKGAAYDGDSTRDKDYGKRGGRKKMKEERTPNLPAEAQWATFLNTLAAVSSPTPSSHGHLWYGCFSTKPLPSEEGQIKWGRKPDLILLEREDGLHNLEKMTWRNIKALGELTSSQFSKNSTLNKSLSTKAYILLCAQPWRRYALAISLASDELRVHLFDRSGIVVSPPIKFHTKIPETCRIVHAFASIDDAILGYDPTLKILPTGGQPAGQPTAPFVGTVQMDSTTYDIVEILWTSNGFVGRCTTIYHVRPQDAPPRNNGGEVDQFDYVVKDVWPEEHMMGHEQMILEHIVGIEGVPSLIKAWTVQYEGADDTTLRHRPSKWDMKSLSPRYTTRVHRRLLTTSVGSPLSSFRSQRELLGGMIMALEIHERLIDQGKVLHRDVSPNNIVFKRSNLPGDRPVLIIDFDYAILLDEPKSAQYPKGTGTLPFISLSVLRQVTEDEDEENENETSTKLHETKDETPTILHEIEDDLEAFFYVFIWICVLYDGPNGVVSVAPRNKKKSIIYTWGEAALQSGLESARRAKNEFIHAPSPNRTIEKQFSDYFKNLAPLAIEWRDEVRKDDARRVRIAERARSGQPPLESDLVYFSHQKIIDLIRKHMHLAR